MGGIVYDAGALISACVIIPIGGLFYLAVIAFSSANWAQGNPTFRDASRQRGGEKSNALRQPRFWGFLSVNAFAWIGFWLVLFAGCSRDFIVVGSWESDAAAQASALLPAYMQDPSHLVNRKYPDSVIGFGLFAVECKGKDKFGCSKGQHIFSPVVPPEPPKLWNDETTADVDLMPYKALCVSPRDDSKGDSKLTYPTGKAPQEHAFWNGDMNRGQKQVLSVLCGGRDSDTGGRVMDGEFAFIFVGFILLVHVTVVLFASVLGSAGVHAAYLFVAVWCAGGGAWTAVTMSSWVGFLSDVDDAYPFREVSLGYAVTLGSMGSRFLFLTSGIALLLSLEAFATHPTTPSPGLGSTVAPSSAPEQEWRQPKGPAQEHHFGETAPLSTAPVAMVVGQEQQPIIVTGTVVQAEMVPMRRI